MDECGLGHEPMENMNPITAGVETSKNYQNQILFRLQHVWLSLGVHLD